MDPREHERKLMEAKSRLFDYFTLQDQRNYYNKVIQRNRRAASQVNFIRASCALLTIVVTATAAYIVQTQFTSAASDRCGVNVTNLPAYCGNLHGVVNTLLLLSILFPALGAFFNMLADLYQWDRLTKVYDEAVKGLEMPDALSPDPRMDDEEYRASLLAYVSGTLKVMRDETGQWGQLIRPPEGIEQFREQAVEFYAHLEQEKLRTQRVGGRKKANPEDQPPSDGG
jgi:hypothetical protein